MLYTFFKNLDPICLSKLMFRAYILDFHTFFLFLLNVLRWISFLKLQTTCIHNSIYAQLKAWANSFITERKQGSARRSLLLWESAKFSQRTKKVNKRPYWLVKNTPHFILWFEREHLIQLTDNCEWKAQNLRGKWRKSKPNELKCH